MSEHGKLRDLLRIQTTIKRCPQTNKICFDKRGAQTAANARFKQDHEKLRIYACPCGSWHLTSKL